jgi:hypothetical protein
MFYNFQLKKYDEQSWICHSEGATRSRLMVVEPIRCDIRFETTATEESPVASWKGEILRRPENQCRLTGNMVGLLRMTT